MFEIFQGPNTHGSPRKLVLLAGVILSIIAGPAALAQSFVVVHNFSGGNDGSAPSAGLTPDGAGGFYGTASTGGARGVGTAYRLWRSGDSWRFSALYAFDGLDNLRDGVAPYAGVVVGADGALYGTTHAGGQGDGCMQRYGCGTVFRIRPGVAVELWDEAIVHGFGSDDGSNPDLGGLVLDDASHLYGTTRNGGANGHGTVFQLTFDRGAWTETVVHSFSGPDGSSPLSGVVFDAQGNLYGTTSTGGANGMGTVYRLQPSGSGWVEDVLYSFANGSEGSTPTAGLIVDTSGNLYGATQTGGAAGGGTVFELSRSPVGDWSLTTLASLSGPASGGPTGSLILDSSGNLYGTTSADGSQHSGSVFKLTRSGGAWSYTSLHDFSGGTDGGTPYGSLVLGAQGNVYGTASAGGAYGQGVIFEITP